MEDVETARRTTRKRRKLTRRQGVVIGVATVAGLGLVSKLVSFLRREKPKNVEDSDIHSLEAVVSGDAANGALTAPQFANLEEDDAHDSDSLTPERDATHDSDAPSPPTSPFHGEENGLIHPTDNGDAAPLRTLEKEEEHLSVDGVDPRSPGHTEQEARSQEVESAELPNEDAETLPMEDVGKLSAEDVERLPTADVQKFPSAEKADALPTEDEGKLASEEEDRNFQAEDAEELPQEEPETLEKQAGDSDHVEKLDAGDRVTKPEVEDPVEDPDEDHTEQLEIEEGKGKHDSSEKSVEAHRVDDGPKNLTQNGEMLQS